MNTHKPYRQHVAPLVAALLSAVIVAFGFTSGTAQSPQSEREIEMKAAAHLPIKIKVKKPEKVKDLKNEDWLGDLEVEVTNTASKPIYHFYIALVLEDVFPDDDKGLLYQLTYGRGQLSDVYEPVRPDDVPLLPGESTVLKLEDGSVSRWKSKRAKGQLREAKKLRISFQWLSHGDGTGFLGPHGVPIPNKRRSSNISSFWRRQEPVAPRSPSTPAGLSAAVDLGRGPAYKSGVGLVPFRPDLRGLRRARRLPEGERRHERSQPPLDVQPPERCSPHDLLLAHGYLGLRVHSRYGAVVRASERR